MKPADIHEYVQYDAQDRCFLAHDIVARNALRLANVFDVDAREAEAGAVVVPAFAGSDDDREGVRLIAEAIVEACETTTISEGTLDLDELFHNAAAIAEEIGVPRRTVDLLIEEFLATQDDDVKQEIYDDLIAAIDDDVRQRDEGYAVETHPGQPDLIIIAPDRDWIVDKLLEMRSAE